MSGEPPADPSKAPEDPSEGAAGPSKAAAASSSAAAGPASSSAAAGPSQDVAGPSKASGSPGKPVRKKKKWKYTARIPPARVKKVMQVDEDIGRMSATVPVVLGRAMEHFAERVMQESGKVAAAADARTLNIRHMKEAVQKNEKEFRIINSLVDPIVERKKAADRFAPQLDRPGEGSGTSGTSKKKKASGLTEKSPTKRGRKKKVEKQREDDAGEGSDSGEPTVKVEIKQEEALPLPQVSPPFGRVPEIPKMPTFLAPSPTSLAAPVPVIKRSGESSGSTKTETGESSGSSKTDT